MKDMIIKIKNKNMWNRFKYKLDQQNKFSHFYYYIKFEFYEKPKYQYKI